MGETPFFSKALLSKKNTANPFSRASRAICSNFYRERYTKEKPFARFAHDSYNNTASRFSAEIEEQTPDFGHPDMSKKQGKYYFSQACITGQSIPLHQAQVRPTNSGPCRPAAGR